MVRMKKEVKLTSHCQILLEKQVLEAKTREGKIKILIQEIGIQMKGLPSKAESRFRPLRKRKSLFP